MKSLLEQQQQEQQGNDQDSNSDQSDQEGESQDSESDSSQQEQDSSESQEGSSDPSDQQPSDQESQPSADGEMSEDMNPSELEQATEEQLARFNEALEEQQALEQWLRRVPMIPAAYCAENSDIKRFNAYETEKNPMKTFAGSVMRALTFLSLMFFSAITLAEIRSDVDRETIGMGESLRLTITGDASERLDQLDLAASI